VVDVDSGEPIAGTLMLAEWVELDGPFATAGFYDAREAITDVSGQSCSLGFRSHLGS
jgi:hypothetical protein